LLRSRRPLHACHSSAPARIRGGVSERAGDVPSHSSKRVAAEG
jgi:hypothetical protein